PGTHRTALRPGERHRHHRVCSRASRDRRARLGDRRSPRGGAHSHRASRTRGRHVSERPLDVWQRTDPRMLLIQPLVELAKALPVLVPLLLFGRSSAGGPPWGLIGAFIVAVLAAVRWATTTYQITPHHIQVRK